MSTLISLILLSLSLLSPVLSGLSLPHFLRQTSDRECYSRCNFKFCEHRSGSIIFGFPMSPTPYRICLRDGPKVRYILDTDEAQVFRDGTFTGISTFEPFTLTDLFPKDFFLVQRLNNHRGSAIDMDTPRGNQHRIIDGECIKLPIKKYERKYRNTYRVEQTSDDDDCIAFRAVVADISIETTWNNDDDYDLSVLPPTGPAISRSNRFNECLNFLRDVVGYGQNSCDPVPDYEYVQGQERIVFDRRCQNFQSGLYTITLQRFTGCNSPGQWSLRVSCKGRQRLAISGSTSEAGRGVTVQTLEFRYPDDCE